MDNFSPFLFTFGTLILVGIIFIARNLSRNKMSSIIRKLSEIISLWWLFLSIAIICIISSFRCKHIFYTGCYTNYRIKRDSMVVILTVKDNEVSWQWHRDNFSHFQDNKFISETVKVFHIHNTTPFEILKKLPERLE